MCIRDRWRPPRNRKNSWRTLGSSALRSDRGDWFKERTLNLTHARHCKNKSCNGGIDWSVDFLEKVGLRQLLSTSAKKLTNSDVWLLSAVLPFLGNFWFILGLLSQKNSFLTDTKCISQSTNSEFKWDI